MTTVVPGCVTVRTDRAHLLRRKRLLAVAAGERHGERDAGRGETEHEERRNEPPTTRTRRARCLP